MASIEVANFTTLNIMVTPRAQAARGQGENTINVGTLATPRAHAAPRQGARNTVNSDTLVTPKPQAAPGLTLAQSAAGHRVEHDG